MEELRYNPPTRLDCAEFGTLYRVLNDDESHTLWVQSNKDHEQPKWIKVGDLLEKILSENIADDERIMPLILELYHEKSFASFRRFCFMLTE